jgi:hypothetical protein
VEFTTPAALNRGIIGYLKEIRGLENTFPIASKTNLGISI